MPDTPVTRRDLVELTASVGLLTRAFEGTNKFAVRTRTILIGAVIAGLIALLGSVAAVVAVSNSHRAQDKSAINEQIIGLVQQYLTAGCQSTNLDRARQKAIWDTLFQQNAQLSKAEGKPYTKAEQKALDDIMAKVLQAYPQRDCSKVKDGVVANLKPAKPTG